MAKVSVRHGIARAYGFLFGRLFQVIGLSWLPALFYALSATFLLERMSGAMETAVPANDGLLGEYAFAYFFALVVVTAFFGAIIAIPLMREALGQHEEPVAAHFVLGGREARLFLAFLRLYIVETILLVALIVVLGVGITTAARTVGAGNLHATWSGIPLQIWLNTAAGLVGAMIIALLATKLGFLLTPVATLERHAGLGRAAALARGNFWRLVFMYVVVGLPATLVLLACETSFGGLQMGKTLPKGMQAFYTVGQDHIALFAGVLAVGLVVLHALFAGAAASAYEELADGAAHQRAYEEAPEMAIPIPAPAAAFADARLHHEFDPRPGDRRAVYEEPIPHAEPSAEPDASFHMEPPVHAEPADVRAIAAPVERYVEATEVPAEDVSTDPHATDVAENVHPSPETEAAHATGEVHPEPANGAAHAETATDLIHEADVAELPPLDPASMGHAQPEEHSGNGSQH